MVAAQSSDVVCEAVALYKEANTEGPIGHRAVLDVIRHRGKVLHKNSCQVVKQKGQFSFVHKNFKWRVTQDSLTAWRIADNMSPTVEDAWYFNSGKRIRKYKFIKRIGAHNFYRK